MPKKTLQLLPYVEYQLIIKELPGVFEDGGSGDLGNFSIHTTGEEPILLLDFPGVTAAKRHSPVVTFNLARAYTGGVGGNWMPGKKESITVTRDGADFEISAIPSAVNYQNIA